MSFVEPVCLEELTRSKDKINAYDQKTIKYVHVSDFAGLTASIRKLERPHLKELDKWEA